MARRTSCCSSYCKSLSICVRPKFLDQNFNSWFIWRHHVSDTEQESRSTFSEDIGHWIGEFVRFLRYGKYGYLPQPQPPAPRCEESLLESDRITATHTDTYPVTWRKGAILNARATAASKLNSAQFTKNASLEATYATSCADPCKLDIRWRKTYALTETATATGFPITATVTLAWDYEVRCV